MLSNKKDNKKLIIITGPTASGKTTLAVRLSSKINGEIISADSRQVYRGMDIGTGKDIDEYCYDGKNIKYHLIDILDPTENYSVYNFQKDFSKSYNQIIQNNKMPILCGGTGLYIESILLNYDLSAKPPPDQELRDSLYQKSKEELLEILKSKTSDQDFPLLLVDTKKQIIRKIEISNNSQESNFSFKPMLCDALVIGVKVDRDTLRKRIKERLISRIKSGMIEEVNVLLKKGLPIERLDYFGLEYKYIGQFIRKEVSKDKLIEDLTTAIRRFAKRQRTWFRRMEKRGIDIHWIEHNQFDALYNLVKQNIDGSKI